MRKRDGDGLAVWIVGLAILAFCIAMPILKDEPLVLLAQPVGAR